MDTHAIEDRLVLEGKLLQVLRLHVSAKNAGSVLEILLRINEGHVEVLLAMPGHNEAGKAATNHKNIALPSPPSSTRLVVMMAEHGKEQQPHRARGRRKRRIFCS